MAVRRARSAVRDLERNPHHPHAVYAPPARRRSGSHRRHSRSGNASRRLVFCLLAPGGHRGASPHLDFVRCGSGWPLFRARRTSLAVFLSLGDRPAGGGECFCWSVVLSEWSAADHAAARRARACGRMVSDRQSGRWRDWWRRGDLARRPDYAASARVRGDDSDCRTCTRSVPGARDAFQT